MTSPALSSSPSFTSAINPIFGSIKSSTRTRPPPASAIALPISCVSMAATNPERGDSTLNDLSVNGRIFRRIVANSRVPALRLDVTPEAFQRFA